MPDVPQINAMEIAGMARPLRIAFAGALFPIRARGNARGDIFQDDADRG
jgi:hypothetical protein